MAQRLVAQDVWPVIAMREPARHRDRLVTPGGPWQTSRTARCKSVIDCPSHRRLDGSAAMAGDQCDHGVEGGFERLGVALDLGQQ
jgi:hypothetical protein